MIRYVKARQRFPVTYQEENGQWNIDVQAVASKLVEERHAYCSACYGRVTEKRMTMCDSCKMVIHRSCFTDVGAGPFSYYLCADCQELG